MNTSSMTVDAAVIGAGPAGLMAAVTAADAGITVAMIDMNARVGGQYWRHGASGERPIGQHQSAALSDLLRRLEHHESRGRIVTLLGHHVWLVTPPTEQRPHFRIETTGTLDPDRAGAQVWASRLLVAVGAYDRQIPIPGWTTPGVVAAGGAQALLKEHGITAGTRIAVGGTGPFLLSVAAGLARGGASIAGVYEYNSPMRWLATPWASMSQPSKAGEGIGYAATFLRHRIPYHLRSVITEIHGEDHVTGVTVARVGADGALTHFRHQEVDAVAMGWGFTPQLEIPVQLGARTVRDEDGSLVVCTDQMQRASVPGLYVAGETCGIGGAAKALAEGELAGLAMVNDSGAEIMRSAVARTQKKIRASRRFSHALLHATPLPENLDSLITDTTVVCRCEEVTAGTVRSAVVDLGVTGTRGGKVTTRAGMGLCQGRECGVAVSCLTMGTDVSQWDSVALQSTQKRSIATPVPLGQLAATEQLVEMRKDQS